ncbi:2-phospho-L-lactate guanylyltransferase [Aneurinibacillus tyrosinisolvens]|uniref:2-phospho-L-lactate guanylyltransferase n=1 Tax=Aneurinibacillus tyrosinisolvens TaxID=1443435 RepID=UPI00063F2F3C|nr:2-phospho-L-lactate guanylyltransferase [Aneurinibacillus tyrosinisolvens]
MNVAIVMQKPIHQAKTRLKNWLSLDERIGLVQSMLFDVLSTLASVSCIDVLGIVTNDPKAIILAGQFDFHIFYEKEVQGMNKAIKFAVDALPDNIEQLLILPADIPLISDFEVNNLLQMVRKAPVTVIPCRKGTGTNGLVLSPPGVINTAFGVNSKEKHCLMATTAGLNYSIFHSFSLSHDIDTVEDLLLLKTMGEGTKTREYLERYQIFDKLLTGKVTL